jgi:FkbM family methyltransferase
MILVSQVIDLASRLGGPRFAHDLFLRRLARWGTYEPEYYLLDHLVDPARAAIDIGANEGIYAGRMAQLCARVHCFEPIPWFAVALRKKLPPSVVVHECALSNRTGSGELRIPYNNDVEMHGTATLETENPLPGSTHVKPVPCRLERLDDVIAEPVGFMKIDVEGHELAILEGAERILRAHRPVLLVESETRHNRAAPQSIFDFLTGLGYVGFFQKQHRLHGISAFDPATDQRPENIRSEANAYVNNFIFVPGAIAQ